MNKWMRFGGNGVKDQNWQRHFHRLDQRQSVCAGSPTPAEQPSSVAEREWGMLNEQESYLKSHHHGAGVCRFASCFPGEFHPRIRRGAESPPAEEVDFARQWIDSVMVARGGRRCVRTLQGPCLNG